MRYIDSTQIESFHQYLLEEEKSSTTISKYIHDITVFIKWLQSTKFEKKDVLAYKSYLIETYAPASVNSILSSLNKFFSFMEWYELRVKNIKIQRKIFSSKETELTKSEYERLLCAAKNNTRLYLLMQTICSTGIRVSELKYTTIILTEYTIY